MVSRKILILMTIFSLTAFLTFSAGAEKATNNSSHPLKFGYSGHTRLGRSRGSFQPLPANSPDFIPISVCPTCFTFPVGVNERGVISGNYFDAGFGAHGFVKKGDSYTSVDPPDSGFTECGRTNDPGYTVGDYFDLDLGIAHPFVRSPDGSLNNRPGFPGAFITFAVGINQRGDIIGSHTDDPSASTGWQGYVMRGNNFILAVNYPGATSTYALDITDNGTIVGAFKTTNPDEEHGFVRTPGGQYSQLDIPGSIQTEAYGINNSGDIVGRYRDAGGVDHGFLLRNGVVTTIDYVGPDTYVWGVNSGDTVVGFSTDSPFGLSTGGFELPKARKN